MNQSLTHHLAPFTRSQNGSILLCNVPIEHIVSIATVVYRDPSARLETIFAVDDRDIDGNFRIYYAFGFPKDQQFLFLILTLPQGERFPSLTKHIHEAAGYERKIHSLMGLIPDGHPDLRPFILHENWPSTAYPLRRDFPLSKKPVLSNQSYTFHKVFGEGIYEIPVGPVHAGIIEPGHFRFSVAGEEIVNLEPKLGYKHRGVEKLFESLPLSESVRLSERVSGDTSYTHSLAFCQAVEQLAEIEISGQSRKLRVIYSEMERLANHVNDIGFIMLDTGYSFGGSSGQRLRETVMQWHETLSGNRYLRGLNTPGGVTRSIEKSQRDALITFLDAFEKDFCEVIEIASESSSVYNRLEGTGTVSTQIARDHGVMGVTGRALGIARDARKDFPYAAYDDIPFAISLQSGGDVRARIGVRVKEVYTAIAIARHALSKLSGPNIHPMPAKVRLKKNSIGIGITEGWRGEIVYTILTDATGAIKRVDVRDPSFLIWPALAQAGRGNVVPDFPLINKSFNLSYAGHDL